MTGRRSALRSLVPLCILLVGCANSTSRKPQYGPNEPFVRYDLRTMVFECHLPSSCMAEPGSKARLLFLGPNGDIIEDHDDLTAPGRGERSSPVYFLCTISREELDRLFEKGGEGAYNVILIIKRPGEPGWQVASDQFTLPR
jgi:hypothetical protein